jgi:hypothetical protein
MVVAKQIGSNGPFRWSYPIWINGAKQQLELHAIAVQVAYCAARYQPTDWNNDGPAC